MLFKHGAPGKRQAGVPARHLTQDTKIAGTVEAAKDIAFDIFAVEGGGVEVRSLWLSNIVLYFEKYSPRQDFSAYSEAKTYPEPELGSQSRPTIHCHTPEPLQGASTMEV